MPRPSHLLRPWNRDRARVERVAGSRAGGSGLLLVLPVLILLAALQAPVAGADVLVTVGGDQIETEGPWEVQGRRIVYTSLEGTLTAIRTERVDLRASERVTEEMRGPKERKRYGQGPVEEHPDLVALAEQTEASRSAEAALILESDTASGPRADIIGGELSRLFERVSFDTATKARLQSHTFSAIRRLSEAVERHDVTTEAGTTALAPELRDIAKSLERAARSETDTSVRYFFSYVSYEITKLARAAEKGPAALAEML
jgi:hypothetical protein